MVSGRGREMGSRNDSGERDDGRRVACDCAPPAIVPSMHSGVCGMNECTERVMCRRNREFCIILLTSDAPVIMKRDPLDFSLRRRGGR